MGPETHSAPVRRPAAHQTAAVAAASAAVFVVVAAAAAAADKSCCHSFSDCLFEKSRVTMENKLSFHTQILVTWCSHSE